MKRFAFTILLIGCLHPFLSAQVNPNIDSLFFSARDTAFAKSYSKALEMCDLILKHKPNYSDAAVLKARIYSWQKDFSQANAILTKVLEQKPGYEDAVNAMISTQKWSKNYQKALLYTNIGISFHPDNDSFKLDKAEILFLLDYPERANEEIRKFLKENPKHEKAKRLQKRINGKGILANRISLIHAWEYFNDPWERNWHITTLQYSRKTKFGSVIPKINMGQLLNDETKFFESPKFQHEIDLYPKIIPGTYAYLSYAYSKDKYFPDQRGGAEIFQSFPYSFEASLGMRWMQFSSDNNIYIYTGAIGKYYKDYWFSFRAFITPKNSSASQSYFLFVRKYFTSGEHYAGIILGKGISPDNPENNIANENIYKLDAYSFKLVYQQNFGQYAFRINAGYKFQEYEKDKSRDIYSSAIYLMYRF